MTDALEIKYGGLLTAKDLARMGAIPLDVTERLLQRYFQYKDASDPKELLAFIRLSMTPPILAHIRTGGGTATL